MASGGHEKEHGEGQPEGDARGEEVPAHETLGFRRHGHALFGGGAGPGNETFLNAPDDSPGVQQHDEAEAAADADGQMSAGNRGAAIHQENQAGRGGDDKRDPDGAQPWAI